jgi:hypothetical protein
MKNTAKTRVFLRKANDPEVIDTALSPGRAVMARPR